MKLLKPIIPSGSEQSIDREMREREKKKKTDHSARLQEGQHHKAGPSHKESGTFFPSSVFPRGQWPWEQTRFVPSEGDAGEIRLTLPAAG